MAEDLVRTEPDDDAPEDAAPKDDANSPYQSRFQLIFGVLLGVGMAAIVATVLVLTGGRKGEDPGAVSWASWHPQASDGLEAVNQIAEHVGQRYTLPSGNQLVGVRGGPLELARLPVTVAIEQQGNVKILDEKGVLYNLCGLGLNCAIKEGKPTVARSLVLRREALELALYTFRYVDNVDMVVAFLPPPPTKKGQTASDTPTEALFFRPGDLKPELARPVNATIAPATPRPETIGGTEAREIDGLTKPNLFEAAFQQGQNGQAFLVLSRIG